MNSVELLAADGFCFWRVFALTYPFSCSNADLRVSSTVIPGLILFTWSNKFTELRFVCASCCKNLFFPSLPRAKKKLDFLRASASW